MRPWTAVSRSRAHAHNRAVGARRRAAFGPDAPSPAYRDRSTTFGRGGSRPCGLFAFAASLTDNRRGTGAVFQGTCDMSDDKVAQESGGCGSAIDDSVRRVLDSADPLVLRAALLTEATERRRAECLANIQSEMTKYTL